MGKIAALLFTDVETAYEGPGCLGVECRTCIPADAVAVVKNNADGTVSNQCADGDEQFPFQALADRVIESMIGVLIVAVGFAVNLDASAPSGLSGDLDARGTVPQPGLFR